MNGFAPVTTSWRSHAEAIFGCSLSLSLDVAGRCEVLSEDGKCRPSAVATTVSELEQITLKHRSSNHLRARDMGCYSAPILHKQKASG